MVLLGVVVVLLAAAAGVVLIAGTAQLTDSVRIDVLGGTLSIPPLALLVTGMVIISVFWLGWAMLRGGLRRGRRRRLEAKESAVAAESRRREQEQEQKRLQDESATREQALVEEHRLREQAEARADAHTTAGTEGRPAARAADTTPDAAHDRTGASPRRGDAPA